jgi:hydrogenase nickel incorporation protein HypB
VSSGRCHGPLGPLAAAVSELDLLLIEKVGNLVCPAEFRIGKRAEAMVYSVTEGEEKPLKCPVMFRAVDVVVINKIDLLAPSRLRLGPVFGRPPCCQPTGDKNLG